MFTLRQEIFMDFAAILSAIRIASVVLFVVVMAASHFHKALIKVELVLWLSLCMYCRAEGFCLECGSWFVTCVHEFWSFHTTCKIFLARCMAVLTNDLYTFPSVCMFFTLSHLVYKTSANYNRLHGAWH